MVIDTSGNFITATDNILVKVAMVLHLRSFTNNYSHLERTSASALYLDQRVAKRRYI